MRRISALILFICAASFSSSQLPTWDGMVSTARTAWKRTVELGKPLAERIAREAPERFRVARRQATTLVARARKYAASGDLEQKQSLAAELWRVRGSLDLMSLLSPETLRMFGIDVPDLTKLREDVTRQIGRLGQ